MNFSYSSIANFKVQTYRLMDIDDKNMDDINHLDMNINQSVSQQKDSLTHKSCTELAHTISRLSNQTYSELREQNIKYKRSENTTAEISSTASNYWGPVETASRIVDSSLAITGGNTEKIKIIVDAVQNGFGDAQLAFGGTLPEISLQTQEAVFSQLDNWAHASQQPNNYSK